MGKGKRMRNMALMAALLFMAWGTGEDQVLASDGLDNPPADGRAGFRPAGDRDSGVKIGADNQKYPEGFTPYPGSRPASGYSASVGEGESAASFAVEARPADVIAHFRRQAEAQGMKIRGEVKGGSTTIFFADRPGGSGDSVKFVIMQSGNRVMGSVAGR